jgi:hypothetical protein
LLLLMVGLLYATSSQQPTSLATMTHPLEDIVDRHGKISVLVSENIVALSKYLLGELKAERKTRKRSHIQDEPIDDDDNDDNNSPKRHRTARYGNQDDDMIAVTSGVTNFGTARIFKPRPLQRARSALICYLNSGAQALATAIDPEWLNVQLGQSHAGNMWDHLKPPPLREKRARSEWERKLTQMEKKHRTINPIAELFRLLRKLRKDVRHVTEKY